MRRLRIYLLLEAVNTALHWSVGDASRAWDLLAICITVILILTYAWNARADSRIPVIAAVSTLIWLFSGAMALGIVTLLRGAYESSYVLGIAVSYLLGAPVAYLLASASALAARKLVPQGK